MGPDAELYLNRLEALGKELLAIDDRRMAVVLECQDDLERGVELTKPIMLDHKRVLAELRALLEE